MVSFQDRSLVTHFQFTHSFHKYFLTAYYAQFQGTRDRVVSSSHLSVANPTLCASRSRTWQNSPVCQWGPLAGWANRGARGAWKGAEEPVPLIAALSPCQHCHHSGLHPEGDCSSFEVLPALPKPAFALPQPAGRPGSGRPFCGPCAELLRTSVTQATSGPQGPGQLCTPLPKALRV